MGREESIGHHVHRNGRILVLPALVSARIGIGGGRCYLGEKLGENCHCDHHICGRGPLSFWCKSMDHVCMLDAFVDDRESGEAMGLTVAINRRLENSKGGSPVSTEPTPPRMVFLDGPCAIVSWYSRERMAHQHAIIQLGSRCHR